MLSSTKGVEPMNWCTTLFCLQRRRILLIGLEPICGKSVETSNGQVSEYTCSDEINDGFVPYGCFADMGN